MPDILFPYTNVDLTEEVNRIPNRFGLLNALNLAPVDPMSSRYVRIDFRDGELVVLAADEPGSPGQTSEPEQEQGTILMIPHFPHVETIRTGDLANGIQVVGGQMRSRDLETETARRLNTIRGHHSVTLEYIRMGMLRGLIKDGRGRTLYDLYNVFGITKKQVDFKLGTASTNIREKCEEMVDHVMQNVKGETVSQVEVIVSSGFFERLISHPMVEKFWQMEQHGGGSLMKLERERLGGNWGRVFDFGDILWREYKGSFPVRSTSGTKVQEPAVAAGKGHAYPAGTMNMFKTFAGPAHHIDMVNQTPGVDDPVFISTKVLDHGEGVEMKSQSNRIAVCKQPECLVETFSSD